mmetsp:Transcript_6765/g.9699  ORF Transcript_6765/g.9699 Transcript_6765/m.9699 type:complete len:85 (+) Transcript_6765:65-319(+)
MGSMGSSCSGQFHSFIHSAISLFLFILWSNTMSAPAGSTATFTIKPTTPTIMNTTVTWTVMTPLTEPTNPIPTATVLGGMRSAR